MQQNLGQSAAKQNVDESTEHSEGGNWNKNTASNYIKAQNWEEKLRVSIHNTNSAKYLNE